MRKLIFILALLNIYAVRAPVLSMETITRAISERQKIKQPGYRQYFMDFNTFDELQNINPQEIAKTGFVIIITTKKYN